jgi:hypothetical protein
MLPKTVYRCNPHPNLMTFFTEIIEKSMLKFIWKHGRPKIAKAMLNKKSNAGGFTISSYYTTELQ